VTASAEEVETAVVEKAISKGAIRELMLRVSLKNRCDTSVDRDVVSQRCDFFDPDFLIVPLWEG
jgi:hypothetical protein